MIMAAYQIKITEKNKAFKSANFLLLIMVGGWFFIHSAEHKMAYLGLGIALVAILLTYLFREKPVKYSIVTLDGFMLFSIIAFLISQYWAAIFLLALGFVGFLAFMPKQIKIDESGILFPSFIPKKYPWAEVEQALLKYDILTIDLKNNHLLQLVFNHNELEGIDEDVFNEYCKQQLATVKP